jgi:thioredoxin 1
MNMIDMTKKDFLEKVFDYENKSDWQYQSDIPCLIDIHDDFCPPCNSIAPVLKELSLIYKDQVEFYKVDVRIEDVLAQELGVKNLPTLIFCPVGKKPVVVQGAAGKESIIEYIETELISNRGQ